MPNFRPLFTFSSVVGTGKIDVTHGLVSASAVSCVMAVNSSHVKAGWSVQTVSVHPFIRALPRDCSEFQRLQSTSTNLQRLEIYQASRRTVVQFRFLARQNS
ncbi:hypothetical protein AVEN_116593-1 [Araneus ventricosus]|uniref:Uncharacterized protein n=1 Tax=Araneus ventricosus TaxID=182803 RepID=A0A4Y2DDV6_ARAVE|nr:hypothetical protein AVEN_116593-1 [Araneus ventricosus]